MAFQQTTATNQSDVCAQIAAFAVANAGFTNSGTVTIATKTVQRLTKSGTTWMFGDNNAGYSFATANTVRHATTPFNNLTTWPTTAQGPEFPCVWGFYTFPGPYTNLFLFTDGNSVHAVVELTNGIFTHFSFGHMVKTDATFNGGAYSTASFYSYMSSGFWQSWDNWTNGNIPSWFTGGLTNLGNPSPTSSGFMLHIKGAGFGDWRDWAQMGNNRNNIGCHPNAWKNSYNEILVNRSPNTGTNRSVMFTNFISMYDSVSQLQKVVGHIPNMRVLSMRNLDDKEIIYTDWQVFPLSQHNGNSVNALNSGEWAYAYKRA